MIAIKSLLDEIDQLCGLIGTEVHGRLVREIEKVEARVAELEGPQVGWLSCPNCGCDVQIARGRTNKPNPPEAVRPFDFDAMPGLADACAAHAERFNEMARRSVDEWVANINNKAPDGVTHWRLKRPQQLPVTGDDGRTIVGSTIEYAQFAMGLAPMDWTPIRRTAP
jgi:hypothetical protein